ncbi:MULTISPECIES: hypothetical protein [unclassified Bradyrhizobium]|uniref:hypothetical protein n=1 Tax=unclassified Bradyrhizobium TaxID=2631580 RepID=UPI001FF90A97|nr:MULTISPECIES: hypothetical protein [unclassified Bradyrhizobium]
MAELGARGWGWTDVLPYFLKLESDLDFGGPLHARAARSRSVASREAVPQFGKAVGEALSAGLPFLKDQNAEFEDGICPPASPTATTSVSPPPPAISTQRRGRGQT